MIQQLRNGMKPSKKTYFSWKWFFISLTIISLFLLIFKFFFLSHAAVVSRQLSAEERRIIQREKINQAIKDIVLKYGVKEEWISRKVTETTIKIPGSIPAIQLCQEIAEATKKFGAEIRESHEDLRTEAIILQLGYKGQLLQNLKFIRDDKLEPTNGKIALVIDDFGYHLSEVATEFLNLDIPLTISIIPGLEYSIPVAEQAVLHQKEILIHLPMEPLEERIEDKGFTILTSMSEQEIRERIKKAYDTFPAATGLNNHQGSKAMADQRIINILIDEIKKQRLFFLDSRTSSDSRGYQTACDKKVPAAARDIFLDDDEHEKSIQEQFLRLATHARKNGKAIGIGHVKPRTLKILKEKIPELQRLGFQFVYVSELVLQR